MEPVEGPGRAPHVRSTTVYMTNGVFGTASAGSSIDAGAAGPTFAAFFSAHRNSLVRALSMTLGDSNLAAEAIDEAMTRAVQRWSKVSTYSKPQAWVYRVAYNWATSRFRRIKRDREYAPRIAQPESSVDPEFDPSIEEALATLSDDHRSVLVLRYFYDWDVQSTADALEISPGTVKSRTSRALDLMAVRLGSEEVTGAPTEEEDRR
jgi:RNA polymerase sigma factor (sigma-70 family)